MGAKVRFRITFEEAENIAHELRHENVKELAKKYNMSYPTLRRKLKEYDIECNKNHKFGELKGRTVKDIRIIDEYRRKGTFYCICQCNNCGRKFNITRQKLFRYKENKCSKNICGCECINSTVNRWSEDPQDRKGNRKLKKEAYHTRARKEKLIQALRIKSRRENLESTKHVLMKMGMWDSEEQLNKEIKEVLDMYMTK